MESYKVLKKVASKENKIFFGIIEKKEELQIVGNGDASLQQDEKAVGGIILLLVNKDFTKVNLI